MSAPSLSSVDYEFYETPAAFTQWLFRYLHNAGLPIRGRCFEPCAGSGAIVRASAHSHWFTNDLDPRWPADVHKDAMDVTLWTAHECEWTVTNPPFTPAIEIASHAIHYSTVGVAMHLRASIHEVLKTGVRRTWMARNPPVGVLWLPRFAYQRSKTTGKWTTDSVCACWCVWLKEPPNDRFNQFIAYAPEWVIDALDQETPEYRARMDLLNDLTGSEPIRQLEWAYRWQKGN